MLADKNVKQLFGRLIKDCLEHQGWDWPKPVFDYTVQILTDKLDKNPWDPQPSYAEQYMTVRTLEQARLLGDTCFFARAVFPDYMQPRGISARYFVELGQGCYERVLREHEVPVLREFSKNFEYLAEMTWTAVRSEGNFRSMWI